MSQPSKAKKFKTIRGGITAPQGFLAHGIACGIKKEDLLDLCLIVSETPSSAAGVTTRNRTVAAPVIWTRKVLGRGLLRAVIANSGNANACTGEQGLRHTERMAAHSARALSLGREEVAVASTGVIGLPLPMDRILPSIPTLVKGLSRSGGLRAARAIMTTDTRPKTMALEWTMNRKKVRMGGMAKGSGMIHPDMATMLAFITTDAALQPGTLHHALEEAVENSFHRITVDGDTSTNDMVLVLANGLSGVPVHKKDLSSSGFQEGLNKICLNLAQAIVQDGEGATKFVTIQVLNGRTTAQSLIVAKKIACSSLVKTALFGEDANWGRIMSAVGSAGIPIRPDKVDIHFDSVPVVKQGITLGSAQEKRAGRYLRKKNIMITVNLHLGSASAEVYTSDLSHDYVQINADYRS